MDNDLMARRLRPPSQPTAHNGASGQPGKPPSPWDVSLTEDGSFAPPQPQVPENDPPFAPPDPEARADVPWDRPAPEAWPPTEDSGTDYPQTWAAVGGTPAAHDPQPAEHDPQLDWPVADATGDATPWDRPANDQSSDPDDAMAPVVADVNSPAGIWHEWSGNGTADGYAANGNGNGNGHANRASGGNGINYAAASTPEPMTVVAHSDQPRGSDEPRSDQWVDSPMLGGTGPSLPEWPAEDDLTPPSSSRGPVMPEDSWPVTPQDPTPVPQPAPWEAAEAAAPNPAPAPTPEPEQPATPEPEQPAMPAEQPAQPQPIATPSSGVTPIVTSAQIVPSAAGSPQNMVLRIELAIVDESHRANPADAAKRVGPDADVRAPEYNPRIHGGRAPMPEPEYEWGAPPRKAQDPRANQRQPGQGPQQPRHVAAPPSAWGPAPAQPQQMDWDLPQIGGPQVGGPQVGGPQFGNPSPDQPAPWSTPPQHQSPQQQAVAPPPTWAMTEPTPPLQPEPPQYMPPPVAPQYQQPQQGYQQPQEQAWPSARSADPLYGVPAAPNQQPTYEQSAYQQPTYQQPTYQQPAPYPQAQQPVPYSQGAPSMPAQSQYPVPSVQSAPAAGSRARTGQANAAADQADLWFLNNQPAATAAEDDAQGVAKSSSLLTAGLTVGFALLVIVLVLVFIQLMTSLLK